MLSNSIRSQMMSLVIGAVLALSALAAPAGSAEDGWRPLAGWTAAGGGAVPPNWQISGGDISHTPGGGDLVSTETFANFELAFDWRVAPGGNSGVMYRVGGGAGAPFQRGPEYQILDNARHPDGRNPLTSAASAYGLYAPSADVTRPAGEWNSARILVDGAHVEHWLNGTMVLAYELGSADWNERVAASKFASLPGYGRAPEGHISLQDHGNVVDYRNMRVRILAD
jgi:hypothetical protein